MKARGGAHRETKRDEWHEVRKGSGVLGEALAGSLVLWEDLGCSWEVWEVL